MARRSSTRRDEDDDDLEAPSGADARRFGGDDGDDGYDDEAFESLPGGEWEERRRKTARRELVRKIAVGLIVLAMALGALSQII